MIFVKLLTIFNVINAQLCRLNDHNTTFGIDNFTNEFTMDYNPFNIIQRRGKGELILNRDGGTRISSKNEFRYGIIDASIKIPKGSNVITSFILMSDNGDEIDFEFVGTDTTIIQTNYFYKGEPVFNVNAIFYKVPVDLSDDYNIFTINWTPEYYQWFWNGRLLRTLFKSNTPKYPDSISKVQLGIWEAPPSGWAGDGINMSNAPFTYYIDWISIKCQNVPPITTTSRTTTRPTTTTTMRPTTTTTIRPTTTTTMRPTTTTTTTTRDRGGITLSENEPTTTSATTTSATTTSDGYKINLSWGLLYTSLVFLIL